MNEFFIYLEDITVSPGYLKGWRIFEMTAVALGPKKPLKNSYSRQLRIVNAVVEVCGLLIASGAGQIDIDRSLFFSKIKLRF